MRTAYFSCQAGGASPKNGFPRDFFGFHFARLAASLDFAVRVLATFTDMFYTLENIRAHPS
jgi:hypothetical protein